MTARQRRFERAKRQADVDKLRGNEYVQMLEDKVKRYEHYADHWFHAWLDIRKGQRFVPQHEVSAAEQERWAAARVKSMNRPRGMKLRD